MLLSAREAAPGTLESPRRGRHPAPRKGFDSALQGADLPLQLLVLRRRASDLGPREVGVGPPPVHADLLRLVDRADDEPDPDGEELDLGEGDPDVARDQQALVEDPVQHVHEARRGAVLVDRQVRPHAGLPRTAVARSAGATSEKIHQDMATLKDMQRPRRMSSRGDSITTGDGTGREGAESLVTPGGTPAIVAYRPARRTEDGMAAEGQFARVAVEWVPVPEKPGDVDKWQRVIDSAYAGGYGRVRLVHQGDGKWKV